MAITGLHVAEPRADMGSSERAASDRVSHREWRAAALIVAICLSVGALGGLMTASGVSTWYPTLEKPAWNPPNGVFGPVWTALYAMMALAYWLVWRRRGLAGARAATALFAIQLSLNLAWSGLFFSLQRPDLALLDIFALLIALVWTTLEFHRHSRTAAALMVPYILWVSFALSLNAAIWWLNL